jgi:hypothetical protein
MSAEAIMAATKGIRDLLLSQLSPGRTVTLLPPGEDPPVGGSGVNLYLYQVSESPYLKNVPYPGDRAGTPGLVQPVLSLELFYLLTPFGPAPTPDDATDEAHAALGEAMLALHEYPMLTRIHLPGFDSSAALPAYLRDSYEDIAVRLNSISVEELSKIWSTIGKPYRLSVAYEVSLVQLTPTVPAPAATGVVQRTAVALSTLSPPRLTGLTPAAGPLATLTGTQVVPAELALRGTRFTFPGQTPLVSVGDVSVPPSAPASDTDLAVQLPRSPGAGPDLDVRVSVHGRTSAPLRFRVTPWMSSITPLRTALDSNAAAGPGLVVTGAGLATATELIGEGQGLRWVRPVDPAATDDHGTAAPLPTGAGSNAGAGADLPNGRYEVRVRLGSDAVSNPRILEVIPLVNPLTGPNASTYAPAQRRLTLRGARLDGTDVRLRIDAAEYVLGAQTGGAQLVYQFAQPLRGGPHTASVSVDGHLSAQLTFPT